MNILLFLIPLALLLGGTWLAAFFWCLKSGQYDDLDGDGWRLLEDDGSDMTENNAKKLSE